MTRLDNQPNVGQGLERIVSACWLAALLVGGFFVFPHENRAAITSLTYDARGNEVSQQAAAVAAPIILGSPSNQVVATGGIGGFSVNVSSPLAVTYQWYFNGVAISGATGDSLLLTDVTAANAGSYTAVVANSSGSVTSAAGQLSISTTGQDWTQAYTPYVQSLIALNHWGPSQVDAYVAFQSITRAFPLNTGGGGLSPGALDLNFFLVSQPAGANYGTTLQVINPYGYVSTPGAQYIAPVQSAGAAGDFGYQTTYVSNFATPTKVVVSGSFAADDSCVLKINDQGPFATASNFSKLYPVYALITIPAGKQITRLDFIVSNSGGPSGLMVSNLSISIPPLNFLANNGFESPDLVGGYQYDPVTPNWGFIGSSGITSNGAGFNAQGATRGQISDGAVSTAGQAAFLQHDGSSFTQYVNLEGGTYNISFDWEARDNNDGNEITVSLGGNLLFDGTPTSSSNFSTISTAYITLPAGVYPLTFSGARSGRDVTTFIDNVAVNNDSGPFVWQGGSGDFNDPHNWGRNRPPGPADTATISSGTFTISGSIYAGTVIVNVPYAAATNSNLSLNITGNWTFTQPVSLSSGYQLSVSGGGSVNFASAVNAALPSNISLGGGSQVIFTSVTNPSGISSISASGAGTVTFPKLSSISGINQISSDYGAQLSFPGVTTYTTPAAYVLWIVQHQGSMLSFPNLKTIVGPTVPTAYLDLNSFGNNGVSTLSLPALTTITKGDDGDGNANSGVRFSAQNNGVISAPNLSIFQDNDSHPNSSLSAYNGGTMVLSNLALSGIRGVTLSGVTLPATIQSIPIVSTVKTGGNVMLTVQTLTGHTYQLQQTSSLSSGSWQNVGSAQSGTGSPMSLTAPAQGTAQFYRVVISPWP